MRHFSTNQLILSLALLAAVFIPMTSHALYFSETEGNNSFATAQSVDAHFTLDEDGDIFLSTSFWHASVQATNGSINDVDYYQFTVGAARVEGFFDIDYAKFLIHPIDTTMALFDDNYNVLAATDNNPIDPGSSSILDAFLGTYTFESAGTYYIGVSNYSNLPLSLGAYLDHMERPDDAFGGNLYTGSGPTAMSTTRGAYSSGDYVLHLSLSSLDTFNEAYSVSSDRLPIPNPEPSTILLLGTGLLALACRGRRKPNE